MATTTSNLGLTKPAGTENPDISVINENMDKIDTAVAKKAESNHKQAYTAAECTDYTADNNTMGITPSAVKKAITKIFSETELGADITE